MKLTKKILVCLADMPNGYGQRIDGLRCEPSIINAGGFEFHLALWLALRRGWIVKWRKTHSIFASANALPFFSLTPAGRAALERQP